MSKLSDSIAKQIMDYAKAAVRFYVGNYRGKVFLREDEVQDIVGETCEKACRYFGSYNGKNALSTWVGAIARNCVKDAVARKARSARVFKPFSEFDKDYFEWKIESFAEPGPGTDSGLLFAEFEDDLESKVSELGEMDQTILMKYTDGDKPAAIAAVLGCTPNSVSLRLFKIRQKLNPLKNEVA